MVALGGSAAGEARLVHAVRASELPVALLDLGSYCFVAMSRGEAALLRLDTDEAVGREVWEFVVEPERGRAALALMTSGGIDAYEARRRVRRADGTTIDAYVWVRHLALQGDPDSALLMISRRPFDFDRLDKMFRDTNTIDLTVGTTDTDLIVDRMSPDVEALLGYSNVHYLGNGLVDQAHPDDAERLRDAIERAIADCASVELIVRFGRADGEQREVRMVVSAVPDESPARLGFSMAGVPPAGQSAEQRAADLEAALGRIANEMRALGITPGMARLPTGASVPELADLSTRQWEIVTRLVRGDRVPAIARAMFLSQNTVRNYLGEVYKKLGVHSQQELIERLRGEMDGPSASQ